MNVVPLRLVKDGQRHTARLTTNPVYVDTQLLPPVPLTPPLKIVKRLNGVEHRQPHALLVDGRIAVRVGIPCSVVSGCAYRGVKRGIQVQKRIVVGASAVRRRASLHDGKELLPPRRADDLLQLAATEVLARGLDTLGGVCGVCVCVFCVCVWVLRVCVLCVVCFVCALC